MNIAIINGPNLNLLGKREPEVYGNRSFEQYFEELQARFPEISLHYFQSNHEGAIIDELHRIGFSFDGIVLNAGAYTHTSIAMADAIGAIRTPVVEVHISNVHKREAYRHHSWLSAKCAGVIVGFGLDSYRLALEHFRAAAANATPQQGT
jgi:3-dehydroquinate dehydratase II